MIEHDARALENATRLAVGTAEDLGQFVTRVRDAVERLAVISSNPEVHSEVESLRSACTRAAELTSQLSALGRSAMPQPQVIDLTRAVSNMVPLLRRMGGDETRVYVDCCSDPVPVLVDPANLRRAMLHLVSQARDAMEGRGRIVVGTRASATGPLLWVGDEGPPFDPRSVDSTTTASRPRRGGKHADLDIDAMTALVKRAGGQVLLGESPAGGGQVEIRFPAG